MSHRSSWIIWNQKSSLKPSPIFGLWSACGSDLNSSVNIQKARESQSHNWHDIYFVVLRCFIIDSNFWRIEDRSTALLVVSSVESCLVTQAFFFFLTNSKSSFRGSNWQSLLKINHFVLHFIAILQCACQSTRTTWEGCTKSVKSFSTQFFRDDTACNL